MISLLKESPDVWPSEDNQPPDNLNWMCLGDPSRCLRSRRPATSDIRFGAVDERDPYKVGLVKESPDVWPSGGQRICLQPNSKVLGRSQPMSKLGGTGEPRKLGQNIRAGRNDSVVPSPQD